MSSSLNPKINNQICTEFERIYKTPTLELFHRFLEKPDDHQAGLILERRFMGDEIWIPEDEHYEQKRNIPILEKDAALFIENLKETYKKNPSLLTARQISLLGMAYEIGMGVEKDLWIGHQLYLESAKHNCGYALISLYNAYYYGTTAFESNGELALKYLEKGISLGDSAALRAKGNWFIKQARNAEPEEQSALYQNGYEHIAKAAEKLDPVALYWLGCAYRHGLDWVKSEKNVEKAIEYLTKAVQRGDIQALTQLYAISQDPIFIQTASEFQDREANLALAQFLEKQRGYNAWCIDHEIIPLLQKSDDLTMSMAMLSNYLLTFRKNTEEQSASYHYKLVRKMPILADKFKETDHKEIYAIFEKQLALPVAQRNHKMNYEFAFALLKTNNSNAKKLMTEFATQNPTEFLSLSQKDSWDIVKDLVDEPCAKLLETRINQDITQIFSGIQQAAPGLSLDLVKLIFKYDMKSVGHHSLFSKIENKQLTYHEDPKSDTYQLST